MREMQFTGTTVMAMLTLTLIYIVLRRNKKGDVLFKMVLNGDEARLPLTPVSGPWYSWAECKNKLSI